MSPTHAQSPHYQYSPSDGTFVTPDGPMLSHHYHSVHSLHYGALYRVGQMYNDMYPPLWYHTDDLKILCALPIHLSLPLDS